MYLYSYAKDLNDHNRKCVEAKIFSLRTMQLFRTETSSLEITVK